MLNSGFIRRALVAGLAVAAIEPAGAADIGEGFASVDAFIKALLHGTGDAVQGYGDLAGSGRRDWAGMVDYASQEGFGTRRVVVLAQQADGSYRVAAQGPEESADGGTSHLSIEEVKVEQGSVNVTWSWSWHGCGGESTQQIKFYRNQWRVTDAYIRRGTAIETLDGYGSGDSATLSHNLLTGGAIIHFEPANGKAVNKPFHLKPSVELLDDSYDSETGSIKQFERYARC